jgi:hypothetical protein
VAAPTSATSWPAEIATFPRWPDQWPWGLGQAPAGWWQRPVLQGASQKLTIATTVWVRLERRPSTAPSSSMQHSMTDDPTDHQISGEPSHPGRSRDRRRMVPVPARVKPFAEAGPTEPDGCGDGPSSASGHVSVRLAPFLAMVAGYRRAGVWGKPEQRAVGPQSTRSKSGAHSRRACSVRSTTRSTFYLVLPARTLTAGFPNLRRLTRTTLGFRPSPDYGFGGWDSNPSRRATNTAGQRPVMGSLSAAVGVPRVRGGH